MTFSKDFIYTAFDKLINAESVWVVCFLFENYFMSACGKSCVVDLGLLNLAINVGVDTEFIANIGYVILCGLSFSRNIFKKFINFV